MKTVVKEAKTIDDLPIWARLLTNAIEARIRTEISLCSFASLYVIAPVTEKQVRFFLVADFNRMRVANGIVLSGDEVDKWTYDYSGIIADELVVELLNKISTHD